MSTEANNIEQASLYQTAAQADKHSRDILESTGQGFAFPVAEKVRNMSDDEKVHTSEEDKEGIAKKELLKASLKALSLAWEQAIKPLISKVRAKEVETLKHGTDFFTEADTKSEEIIRNYFVEQFGEQSLRIFGEEANRYSGNEKSRIGVRIDPIDGTESFKFSKDADWGIMIGVYEGTPENDHQIISAVYFPERQQLLYSVDGVGVFGTNMNEGKELQLDKVGTKEYTTVPDRDDVKDIITSQWKHTDASQRGNNTAIENALVDKKARIRSTDSSCGEVLEALESNGKRAIILDGDFNQVDFIPFTMLEKVGYKIYDWQGNEKRADDPELTNQKLVVVPPGKAGQEILETIKQAA